MRKIKKNIAYKSQELVKFYSKHRKKWNEFYPSERRVLEKVYKDTGNFGDVLDVGCACGGLGFALSARFNIRSYTGIDINRESIRWAQKAKELSISSRFVHGDIIKPCLSGNFDTVVSFSCADWNIETDKIIKSCWKKVKAGGYLIISLRLTPGNGINDIRKSHQYINFSGKENKPEIANYVVFNFKEALKTFKKLSLSPALIGAYGYWGKPSPTAATPFKKLIFAVFYIRKSSNKNNREIRSEFSLPIQIYL